MPEGQAGIHRLVEKRPAEFAVGGVLGPNDGSGYPARRALRGSAPTPRQCADHASPPPGAE